MRPKASGMRRPRRMRSFWMRGRVRIPGFRRFSMRARTGILYTRRMAVETTYTQLRDRLASILDRVVENQEVVIVRRKKSEDVALIPAAELSSVLETAHLLRSPKNAQRLLRALRRAERHQGKPTSPDQLRRETGLAPR